MTSRASPSAHVASATATEARCDLEALDPKRWEVSVNVDGTNVLTIGSHGYLAGYSDIDRFGDAVRAAGEHLLSFIGTGEPAPCFACGGSGRERWLGECGEEVGPCSVCGDPEDHSASVAAAERSEAGCAGNLPPDEPQTHDLYPRGK